MSEEEREGLRKSADTLNKALERVQADGQGGGDSRLSARRGRLHSFLIVSVLQFRMTRSSDTCELQNHCK